MTGLHLLPAAILTYEVCHGKHVRQYHEEKETGQKISIQEYFLGVMAETGKGDDAEDVSFETEKEVPTRNIEGQFTPYYSVGMGNGTPCVLKQNQARATSVLYVCHPEAKHEILSIAEVTTCEYEVALLGSPLRPQQLTKLDMAQQERLKPPFSSVLEAREVREVREVMEDREEDTSPVREEAFTSTHKPLMVGGQSQVTVGSTHISRLTDDQLIKEFLSGSYCLHGGVGWWKYEFCYGKHVHQYHEDKEQGKNIVVVGSWKAEEHLEWAKKNVARSYQLKEDGVQKVKLVSHFYGHGDTCKESESPHAVTVYMLEPQTCQYILGEDTSPVREEAFTSTHKPLMVGGQSQVTVGSTHISRLTDDQLIKEFLSGSYCLHGDKEQGKNIVVVGSWKAEEHLECKESESPHAVTVYMLEPQTCQYILGVESPVICRILDTADEHGHLSISI
ncbi:hypothetical protein CRUP_010617 [Coryphaenoides rupestris]|nr:hypothetical protein CRUP_010617 [Coryphaenoides rupestris]